MIEQCASLIRRKHPNVIFIDDIDNNDIDCIYLMLREPDAVSFI